MSDGFGGTSTCDGHDHGGRRAAGVHARSRSRRPQTFTTPAAGNGFGESVASVAGNVAIGAPLRRADTAARSIFYDGVPTDDGVVYADVTNRAMYAYAA